MPVLTRVATGTVGNASLPSLLERDPDACLYSAPVFPAVGPIPLPAPVWLLKLLHVVALALHFVAVEMLLGGLLVAVVLSLFRSSPPAGVTARALARRLTIVMTFLINLGVPPMVGTPQDVDDLANFLNFQVNPPAPAGTKSMLTAQW